LQHVYVNTSSKSKETRLAMTAKFAVIY